MHVVVDDFTGAICKGGLSAMYVRNRTPMKALDRRTAYEVLYDMKLGLGDSCAFGALRAIVGPSESLKRVDCGLSNKQQWGACDICATYIRTYRVRSRSCYAVWTSQPVVGAMTSKFRHKTTC